MDTLRSNFNTIGPHTITPDHVRGLSLHEVTQQYGTIGLYTRLQDTLAAHGLDQAESVQWAVRVGLTLHANDTRTNGHYNDHVMRGPLRAIEHLELTDEALISGLLLHDTVEDHPKDLVYMLTGEKIEDIELARVRALAIIGEYTSDETAEIVRRMTNPVVLPGEDKQTVYENHMRDIVLPHPPSRAGKFIDFWDNAGGNHYTIGVKQPKLDEKYLPIHRLHLIGLYLPDGLITGEIRARAADQLIRSHTRALARLAMTQ